MSPRPSYTPEQREETRTAIVAATARVMAHTGYRGATIQAIASEAGCSAPTLYKYFESKDDILRGMIERVQSDFMRPFAAPVDPQATAEARIAALLREVYDTGAALRELMAAFARLSEEACNLVLKGGHMDGERMFAEAFCAWVAQHLTDEDRGGLDAKSAAYLLNGITYSQFLRWIHEEFSWDLSDRAALVARYFCKAVAP